MTRRVYVIGVVMMAALAGSDAPHAQTPATDQRVWTGTWEEHDAWEGHSKFGRKQAQISFVYVEGRNEFGTRQWNSRRLTWSALWEESQFDYLVVLTDLPPDARGFTSYRYSQDSFTTCAGGGTLELGPEVTGTEDFLTPEQKAQLRLNCVTTYEPRDSSVPTPPPSEWTRSDELPAPSLPNEDQLVDCAYEKSWPKGGRPAGSFSVSVSAPVTAVMEVDPDPKGEYGRFVPAPGQTLTFVASVPAGTARFRFELDLEATSHFPGYATNANVDDAFFVKYNLGHLRGRYANDGPDMIFDKEHFGGQEWSRIEPLVVETRIAQGAAVVAVTAMDYGAVGRLRAFVKSEDCGDWMPVPVRVGTETREAIAIPMDEDENLMADALENYRGRASGADDDAEPKGNGMAGDGLTAFEEYRGFLVRGVGCGTEATDAVYSELELHNQSQVAGWSDEHRRTSPKRKDLFVHTPDPELALVVPAFATATDLEVHLICEPHYDGNESRVVNFSLHKARMRTWQGKAIAHEEPQHGIRLEPVDFLGLRGLAVPVTDGYIGPPRLTRTVQVIKPRPDSSSNALRARLELPDLVHTLVHELGHAVGIPHHGDRVDTSRWQLILGRQNVTTGLSLQQHAGGPPDITQPDSLPEVAGSSYAAVEGRSYLTTLLVEPGEDCVEGAQDAVYYREGQFAGCTADSIARRGQQNSGDFECPMRYSGSNYYEPPETVAQFRWTGLVTYRHRTWQRDLPGHLVDAWGGRLLRYRNDLDRDGTGRLCTRITGTVINSLPGDQNHAGDAGREQPCVDFLVVNDLAAPGMP